MVAFLLWFCESPYLYSKDDKRENTFVIYLDSLVQGYLYQVNSYGRRVSITFEIKYIKEMKLKNLYQNFQLYVFKQVIPKTYVIYMMM